MTREKLLNKVLRAIRIARLIDKAQSLAASGRAREAMGALLKAYDLQSAKMPSRTLSHDVNLLAAIVSIHCDNPNLALSSVDMSIAQLEGGEGEHSMPDRAYMVEYAKSVRNYCRTWLQEGGRDPIDQSAVESPKVSTRLKRLYPVRDLEA